ncbi:MAG TPA: winged helix DNA-binding domain-containing protein [Streptosporangiaceae bacterium]
MSARRLGRSGLAEPASGAAPADVVAAMCGAHAQVLAAAELSVGLRLAGATRADVRHALWTERSLVKTFGPRGTVHLLPARDLALWAGALAAIPGPASGLPGDSRLTAGQLDEVIAAIAGALAAAELTIDELSEAVIGAAGPWAGDPVVPGFGDMWPRWRQALPLAGARGVLCFGPSRARRVTYTSPRRWQPGFRPLEGPAAVPELARRYLHAYGPATPQHFAQWLGAPRPWAGQVFAALAGELQQVDLEGTPAWQLAADASAGSPAGPPRGVRLLPYFDAYAVAGQPRPLLFPGAAAGRALGRGQAGTFPVLLIDGTVAGVWHQRRSARRIAITVEPLRALTGARRRELGEQAERVAAVLEGRAELTIGAVSVGAHA